MGDKLVSILIPNFNKSNYLSAMLDSLLSQSYSHWECIIVDDHSTDNSWVILEEFAAKDSRFRLYRRPDNLKSGGNAARNFAFEMSKGDYIQWLDSDDLIHSNKIEIQLDELKDKTRKVVSVSNWESFEQFMPTDDLLKTDRWHGCPQDSYSFLLSLWEKEQFVPHHAYLMPRNILKISGLWNEELIQNQDGEFMTRVLLASDQIIFNPHCLAFYRLPSSSHLSKQVTYRSWNDWVISLTLCDQWILNHQDTNKARRILSLNYERIIKLIILDYPEIAQKAIHRIKFLNPLIRFNFFKPQAVWLGAWIGINKFLMLWKLFKGSKT